MATKKIIKKRVKKIVPVIENIVENGSVKYGFREVFTDEETGKQHFTIPRSNPMEYENDYGYLFDSVEEAGKYLQNDIENQDVEEDEVQNWYLVKIVEFVVEGIPAKHPKK